MTPAAQPSAGSRAATRSSPALAAASARRSRMALAADGCARDVWAAAAATRWTRAPRSCRTPGAWRVDGSTSTDSASVGGALRARPRRVRPARHPGQQRRRCAERAASSAPTARLWQRDARASTSPAPSRAPRRRCPDAEARDVGRIVNIASTAGLTGYPYVAAYCAAKHGVIGLTRALALELARDGVTVERGLPRLHRHAAAGRRGREHRRQDRPERRRGARGAGRSPIRRAAW